jgi:hypothetical protein
MFKQLWLYWLIILENVHVIAITLALQLINVPII